MRGLWQLVMLETKIFLREPLGAIGTVLIPVAVFMLLGRFGATVSPGSSDVMNVFRFDLPVFAAILIALNAVLSLVAIIAIYREGGILKRLRATPLRPQTILTAHVVVKLMLTATTLILTLLAGRRYFPAGTHVPVVPFTIALLVSTLSILSMGFLIASIVPTARFAQPIGSIILYPMLALSGLFVPIAAMPRGMRVVAHALPLTYSVSLLQGAWRGDPWSAHLVDFAALTIVFVLCIALSSRVFRWE
ncbi:MAG: ABC transporter permease [Gemmatimonadales bacterium]